MVDLIPAEEWVAEICRRRSLEEPDMLATLERTVPDIQRNAAQHYLEAAAKRLDGLATNAGDDCAWCIREMAKELDPAPPPDEVKL